ncbi:MAG: NHL repeat-containing protein [Candidatus Latescibacterota bacterium]
MRVIPILLAALLSLSCAGKMEEKTHQPSALPPAVTGSVHLSFFGVLGTEKMSPWGMSFGADGTLYVCDRDHSSVIRMNSEGKVISRFNGLESRVERIFAPVDVCASGGIDVYVLDGANSRIIRLDRDLRNASVVYNGSSEEKNRFGTFNGIAYDRESGDLYITNGSDGSLIRMDMVSKIVSATGSFGSEKKSLLEPIGLDIDKDGALLVADRKYGAAAIISHFGTDIRYVGKEVLEAPVDIAALPQNRLAVADRRGVVILSRSGTVEGMAGFGVDRKMAPRSVAYHEGKLYISDTLSGSVLVYRIDE